MFLFQFLFLFFQIFIKAKSVIFSHIYRIILSNVNTLQYIILNVCWNIDWIVKYDLFLKMNITKETYFWVYKKSQRTRQCSMFFTFILQNNVHLSF